MALLEVGDGAADAGDFVAVLVGVDPFVVDEERVADAAADALLDVGDARHDGHGVADVDGRGDLPGVGGHQGALGGVGHGELLLAGAGGEQGVGGHGVGGVAGFDGGEQVGVVFVERAHQAEHAVGVDRVLGGFAFGADCGFHRRSDQAFVVGHGQGFRWCGVLVGIIAR